MIANYQMVADEQKDRNRMIQYISRASELTSLKRQISIMRDYVLAGCSALTSASFPNCTSIASYAFAGCTALTSVFSPNCTTIGSHAFMDCTALTSASFSNCTTIGNRAFNGCSALTSVSFPNCTTISAYAFGGCTALTSVSFPNCTTAERSAFVGPMKYINLPKWSNGGSSLLSGTFAAASLETVLLPSISRLGKAAFSDFRALTTVDLTNVSVVGSSAFYGCSALATLSLPNVSVIYPNAFMHCSILSSLYLMGSKVCKLSTTNWGPSYYYHFYGTPIESGTGRVYVPQSLLASYKAASVWRTMSSVIVGI